MKNQRFSVGVANGRHPKTGDQDERARRQSSPHHVFPRNFLPATQAVSGQSSRNKERISGTALVTSPSPALHEAHTPSWRAAMRERLTQAMKDAMRAKDQKRLTTIRLVLSAI